MPEDRPPRTGPTDQHSTDHHHPVEPDGDNRLVPHFDVVLWGYRRQQVEQCFIDLTAQLREAWNLRKVVESLRTQLRQAEREVAELRAAAERQPPWSEQLANIMEAAEQLRRQAERETQSTSTGR